MVQLLGVRPEDLIVGDVGCQLGTVTLGVVEHLGHETIGTSRWPVVNISCDWRQIRGCSRVIDLGCRSGQALITYLTMGMADG